MFEQQNSWIVQDEGSVIFSGYTSKYEVIKRRGTGAFAYAHVLNLRLDQHLSPQQFIVKKLMIPRQRHVQSQQTTSHQAESDTLLRSEKSPIGTRLNQQHDHTIGGQEPTIYNIRYTYA